MEEVTSYQKLVSNKWRLLLNAFLIILIPGMVLSAPAAISGFKAEGNGYSVYFYVPALILLILSFPGIVSKLFLMPVSAILEKDIIYASFCLGKTKEILLQEITGYSNVSYWTRHRTYEGLLLYLKNGDHVEFTEMNLKEIDTLKAYLNQYPDIKHYGSDKPAPVLFKRRYKYQHLVN